MRKALAEIKARLEDAVAFAGGESSRGIAHKPHAVAVKAVRRRLGMTQERFAMAFGVSLATLRHWERGDRSPRGPALVLLNVVEQEPSAVLRAIG